MVQRSAENWVERSVGWSAAQWALPSAVPKDPLSAEPMVAQMVVTLAE